jgi:hypothetical protein
MHARPTQTPVKNMRFNLTLARQHEEPEGESLRREEKKEIDKESPFGKMADVIGATFNFKPG